MAGLFFLFGWSTDEWFYDLSAHAAGAGTKTTILKAGCWTF